MADQPITVRQWTDVVRRARLGRTVKAVALTLATYADYHDGSRVRPGIARLAVDCELGYNAVQDAMADLRGAGLIEMVRPAAKRGQADEYRLTLADDVLDRVEVLTPAQLEVAAERIRDRKRGRYRHVEIPGQEELHPFPMGADIDLHPARVGADPVDNPPGSVDNPDLHPSARGADTHPADEPAPIRAGRRTRPAPIPTADLHPSARGAINQGTTHTPTNHPAADLRTAVTGPRARDAPTQDPDPLPEKCPHGLRARRRPDGTSSCGLCRRTEPPPEPATPALAAPEPAATPARARDRPRHLRALPAT